MDQNIKEWILLGLFLLCASIVRADVPSPCPPISADSSVLSCWLTKMFLQVERGAADSCLVLSRQLQVLTEGVPFLEGRREYVNSLAYHAVAKYDSSRIAAERSAEIYLELGQLKQLGMAYNTVGNSLREKGQLAQATEYYFKSIDFAEQAGADSVNTAVYINLSTVFLYLDDRKKQFDYILKAYRSARKYEDDSNISRASMGLVQGYLYNGQIDSAAYFANEALESASRLQNNLLMAYSYLNLAEVAMAGGLWEEANLNFQKIGLIDGIPIMDRARFLLFYGDFLQKRDQLEAASFKYEEGYKMTRSIDALNLQHTFTTRLHPLYKQLGDVENAYRLAVDELTLRDSIYHIDKEERIRELNTQFETAETEMALQAEKIKVIRKTNQRNMLIGIAIALLFFGLVIVYGLRRRVLYIRQLHAQKEEIAEQRIRQLQQDQKYLAFKSMVAGEEAERSRLAKDLHDGLGGMLSNLKLTLSKYFQKEGIAKEQSPINILDRASSELRRIAQNVMPESLARFGLIQALEDLFSEVPSHAGLDISFQHFNIREPLPNMVILPMYRIIQELLNNVIKHARASEALIQLIQRDERLYLTVEDNGIGLHWDKAVHKGGHGLGNIESRVEFLKGQLQVESTEGAGTTVNIEIPIPDENDTTLRD